MTKQHLPTPWHIEEGSGDIRCADGRLVLMCASHHDQPTLRRIVACVNAFEGLATEAIEAHADDIAANKRMLLAMVRARQVFNRGGRKHDSYPSNHPTLRD